MASAATAVVVIFSLAGAELRAPSLASTPAPSRGARTTSAPLPTKPAAQHSPASGQPAGAVNCRVVKCVALTFDDGPVRQTAGILDVLASRGARATFFVQGIQARRFPKILRRMAAEGHVIGNHSWNHPMFAHLSAAQIAAQLQRTDKVITAAVGPHRRLVRPPGGQVDPKIRKAVAAFGAPIILWSVDPEDWKFRNTKRVTTSVVKRAHRNSIVLMHDIRPTTRAAVATIVDRLQAEGYTLVTVPELFSNHLTPGAVYRHR